MALEALGIAANVAGLIDLGFTVCHDIWTYYEGWKDAESDMRKMYNSIETLTKSFALLKEILRRPHLNARVVERVEESVGMCKDGIECLYKKLKKIQAAPQATGSKWKTKARAHLQRALYPFKESTLVKLKEISNEMQGHLQLALEILQIDTSATTLQSLHDLSNSMFSVSASVRGLDLRISQATKSIAGLTAIHQNRYQSLVHAWLSPLFQDFDSKHNATLNTTARQDGLGNWLVHSLEYQQWLQSTGTTLWCLGSRGVGKTVLASFIIDSLQRTKSASTGIAFIYCNYNDPQKQTAINIIGCILQQLMLQNDFVAEELAVCYENHHDAKTLPSVAEYSTLLRSAVGYFTKAVLIVDALDECHEDTRDTIMGVFSKLQPGVNVLITSRHAMATLFNEQTAATVRLKANDLDIKNYLEERVAGCRNLKAHRVKDRSLHDYIVSSIAGKARGMFLLARLQLDSLMAKPTLRKIKSALSCLPEELDSMYDQTFERIQNQDPEIAAFALKLLSWVHHSIRPLHLQELRHALAVEHGDASFDEEGIPDESLMEIICCGIMIVQDNGTVDLVHYTASEYLKRKSCSLFPNANTSIAHGCLTYLCFDDFEGGPSSDDQELEARLAAYPLLSYASRHWADHLRGAGEEELERLVLGFFEQKSQLISSVQVMEVRRSQFRDWSQDFPRGVDGLCLSSSYGLYHICDKLLERGADVNSSAYSHDSVGQGPLIRAANAGFVEIVRLLIDNGAELEVNSSGRGRTSLHHAAIQGHRNVVELLLSRGAYLGARDMDGWTPLHHAASKGYTDIVAVMLSQDVDLDVTDVYHATPLYRAAETGHDKVVQLLLDKGALVDVANTFDQTALHRTADVGHLKVTQLLLERGANYRLKDYYGWTPLYRALDHGHDEIASLLADFAEAAQRERMSQPVEPGLCQTPASENSSA